MLRNKLKSKQANKTHAHTHSHIAEEAGIRLWQWQGDYRFQTVIKVSLTTHAAAAFVAIAVDVAKIPSAIQCETQRYLLSPTICWD